MKVWQWTFAVALALATGVVAAAPSLSSPVCAAGRPGDHPAGVDADADGVPDSEDWCVNSPSGSRVGADGCALGEFVVECERMPQPVAAKVVPVEKAPAPPPKDDDEDNDGVENDDDECPGTPKGTAVDRKGCAIIEKVVLKGVNFATGSHALKPAAHATLRAVASAMKADDDLEVEVEGHTDSVGREDVNQKLSERRAQAVKAFLVKEGIDDDRLTTKGYGETQPAETNDTPEGRADNRRVTFRITDD